MDKTDIIQNLTKVHLEFCDYLSTLSKTDFEYAPAGKWSSGQQFQHVYLSIFPLSTLLQSIDILTKLKFGTTNRKSRSYDQMVSTYLEVLIEAGKKGIQAPKKMLPSEVVFSERDVLVEDMKNTLEALCKGISGFSERDIHSYLIPHPVMGALTMKEMLFFTIYHCTHHHLGVEKNLTLR